MVLIDDVDAHEGTHTHNPAYFRRRKQPKSGGGVDNQVFRIFPVSFPSTFYKVNNNDTHSEGGGGKNGEREGGKPHDTQIFSTFRALRNGWVGDIPLRLGGAQILPEVTPAGLKGSGVCRI